VVGVEKSAFLEGDIVFSETALTFNVSTKDSSLFDNMRGKARDILIL
jgi:hypothetical protein